MANKGLISKSILTDIADAIREKDGTSADITPAQMANKITNLPAGGVDFDEYNSWEVQQYLTEKKSSDGDYCCNESYVRDMNYYRLLNNDNYQNVSLDELPKLENIINAGDYLSQEQRYEIWHNYFTLVEEFFTSDEQGEHFIHTKLEISGNTSHEVYYFKDYYPCEDQDGDADSWSSMTGYPFNQHLENYSPYVVFDCTDLNCLTTWMAHGYVYFEFPDSLNFFAANHSEARWDFSSIFDNFVGKVIPEGKDKYYFLVSNGDNAVATEIRKYFQDLEFWAEGQNDACIALNDGKDVTLYLGTSPSNITDQITCKPSGGSGSGSGSGDDNYEESSDEYE